MPVISRRSLLRSTPAAVLSARAAVPGISVGIITEPGGTHLDLLVKGLAKSDLVRSVAVADPSGGSFERVRGMLGPHASTLRTFATHGEMLRAATPAFVIVTVEAHHNPSIVRTALEAGAHVMCEKPPSITLGQFEDIAAVARTRRKDLSMAMATRANPAAREARDIIRRGWLGKLYGATMTWVGDQTRLRTTAWQKSWLSSKERAGGGKLVFHGIHYLDLVQYITGERIAQVNAFCSNVGGSPIPLEDAAVVAFRFRGGATGTLNTGYYLDKGNSNLIQLWGERGWIRFDPFVPLRWYSTHPDAPRGEQTNADGGLAAEYDTMVIDAVRAAAGSGSPFMTTEESLSVMRVIFAGYRASESRTAQTVA